MRLFVILPLVASGMLLAGKVARADAPVPAPADQTAAATSDSDKIVCRTLAAKTGSRLGARRDCRTQKEWDDIQHRQQDEVSKMQARGLTSGVRGQ